MVKGVYGIATARLRPRNDPPSPRLLPTPRLRRTRRRAKHAGKDKEGLFQVPLVGQVQVAAALGAEHSEEVVAFQGQVNLSFESGAEVQFLLE